MKKIMTIFAMLMLLVAITPMALADDNTTVDTNTTINMTEDVNDTVSINVTDDDEAEVEVMATPYGAEVRLEQLKLSIERNVARGNAVIEEGNFTEETQLLLNSILDDLSSLIDDINSLNLDQDSSVLAEEYVAIKKQAITLSYDFKIDVHKEVAAIRIEEIKMRSQERANQRIEDLKQKMQEKREDYEHKKAFEAAKRLGIEVDENSTVDDIVSEIKSKVSEMSPEQKEKATRAYVEFKAKERVMVEATKERAKENFQKAYEEKEAEMQKRIQQRIDDSTLSPKEREIMQERMEQVRENTRERVLDDVENRVEMRKEALEKMREQGSSNNQEDDNETEEVDEE